VTLNIVDQKANRATGKGKWVLQGTKSNSLHDTSFLSVRDFTYVSGATDSTVISEMPLGVGNASLPYLIGRHDGYLRVFHAGDSLGQKEQKEGIVLSFQRFQLP
jgi:acetoacetate decarboxylase